MTKLALHVGQPLSEGRALASAFLGGRGCPRGGAGWSWLHRGPQCRLGPPALSLSGRTLIFGLLACLTMPVAAQPATAEQQTEQAEKSEQRIPARQAPSPCVAVDIGGQRAGHLDCAVQRLEEAARIGRIEAGVARGFSVPAAGSPDVRVGVSSLSGIRLRMGGNLGTFVRPSRPVIVPTNPMGSR